jgi:hypothetical protein
MGLFPSSWAKRIILFFAALIAVGMPLSVFLQSVGSIGLISTAIITGSFKQIISEIKTNKLLWPPIAIYLLHVLGLLWTNNYDYALHDLRVKLPMLSLPIAFAATKISRTHLHVILTLFTLATLTSTLIAFGIHHEWLQTKKEITDIRHISIFVSHVRLSLFIVFSIVVAGYLSFYYRKHAVVSIPVIVWMLYFLFLIQSATGFVVLIGVLFILVMAYLRLIPGALAKVGALVLVFSLPLAGVFYTAKCVKSYYTITSPELYKNLVTHTANGNEYEHQTQNKQLENGYFVWYYINYGEASQAWAERSDIPINGFDKKGQPLFGTLFRYATSKGLHKDYQGISSLTDEDVKNIEEGKTSAHNRIGIRKRIDEIIFEFDMYLNGGNPSGNSVTQRFEFWKNAFLVIGENLWLGVGTGDTRSEMKAMYLKSDSVLKEDYQLGAHNQFITFLLGFGVLGLPVILAFLLLPFFSPDLKSCLPYLSFLIIVLFSFLSEDTLETQAGVTFFAFFSGLFAVSSCKT